MKTIILEQSLERQASRIRELERQQDEYRRRAEKAERAYAELQADILRVGGFEAASRQIVEEKARLREALQDALGIVQASIVNARNRNEYPTIIAGLERREAAMRAALKISEAE